jgi:hypothetical protein
MALMMIVMLQAQTAQKILRMVQHVMVLILIYAWKAQNHVLQAPWYAVIPLEALQIFVTV